MYACGSVHPADLMLCLDCDAGAEGILALQNGMSLTRLRNNSDCINAKYNAGHLHRSKQIPVPGKNCCC